MAKSLLIRSRCYRKIREIMCVVVLCVVVMSAPAPLIDRIVNIWYWYWYAYWFLNLYLVSFASQCELWGYIQACVLHDMTLPTCWHAVCSDWVRVRVRELYSPGSTFNSVFGGSLEQSGAAYKLQTTSLDFYYNDDVNCFLAGSLWAVLATGSTTQ